eukprot:GHVO01040767.1.p1 GENE.GHVO01040767.1~~GHVO01040767.1.p1  ORF type:complete len:318 (-),score=41.21 GHVO01040767.1:335-1288(-)
MGPVVTPPVMGHHQPPPTASSPQRQAPLPPPSRGGQFGWPMNPTPSPTAGHHPAHSMKGHNGHNGHPVETPSPFGHILSMLDAVSHQLSVQQVQKQEIPDWARPPPPRAPASGLEIKWLDIGPLLEPTEAISVPVDMQGDVQTSSDQLGSNEYPASSKGLDGGEHPNESPQGRQLSRAEFLEVLTSKPSDTVTVLEGMPPAARDGYLSVLIDGDLSSVQFVTSTMEVLNGLIAKSITLSSKFIESLVSRSIQACSKIEDQYVKQRLARLICLFVQAVQRTDSGDCISNIPELRHFCIEFSKMKEASNLYRSLSNVST